MSSGKLFQTAGAACEKARSAKARLVRSSCSRFHLDHLEMLASWTWCVTEVLGLVNINSAFPSGGPYSLKGVKVFLFFAGGGVCLSVDKSSVPEDWQCSTPSEPELLTVS